MNEHKEFSLANDPDTSQEVLEELSKSPSDVIRGAVALNANARQENLFTICCLIITLLATACNNQSDYPDPTEQLSDRVTATMTVATVSTTMPDHIPTGTSLPSPTNTLVPAITSTPTAIPTETPTPNGIMAIIGTWEGVGTGAAGALPGSFDTERRIEVKANCEDNTPCIDVYHLDIDVTYLSMPYDLSLSDEMRYCFGGFDYDNENQTTYSICLLLQPDGSLEFSEGNVAFSGGGTLYKISK